MKTANQLESKVIDKLKKLNMYKPIEWVRPDLISTGSLNADYQFGGGFERGRITLVVGDPGYGKTTLSIITAANIIRNEEMMTNGGRICFVDMEKTYSPNYAEELGLTKGHVDLFQPESGENMLDAVSIFLEHKLYDMIVIDSIAETGFTAEIEMSAGDANVGLAARKWGAWIRGNKTRMSQSGTVLYMINRTSPKIGGYPGQVTYYGGEWQRYAISLGIKMEKPEKKDGVLTLRPKAFKNKRTSDVRIVPDFGKVDIVMKAAKPYIDPIPEIVEIGGKLGVFVREDGRPVEGSCGYFYNGVKIGEGGGAPSVKAALYKDLELAFEIEDAVREAMMLAFHPDMKDADTGPTINLEKEEAKTEAKKKK